MSRSRRPTAPALRRRGAAALLAAAGLAGAAPAQDPPAPPSQGTAAPPGSATMPPSHTGEPVIPATLIWEQHRGLVVAHVDGQPIRLQDIARHIESRYDPGLIARWSDPDGSRDLNSPMLPQLIYQYVDLVCLRSEARVKETSLAGLEKHVDALLAADFEDYLQRLKLVRQNEKLTDHAKEFYRAKHRRAEGLKFEIKALLDALVPPNYSSSELRDFHFRNGTWFGGEVKFAHIMLYTRDKVTGRRKSAEEIKRARATAHDIISRLSENADNFGDLARKFSEDTRTAARGGEVAAWTRRLNARLPAALVRAAWMLPNGGVTAEPVETFYGLHIVRRLKLVQNTFVLPGGKTWQKISGVKSQIDQEEYLLQMRKRHDRKLYL